MKLYTNINEINIEEWKDLLQRSSVPSFFQTREAYDFFSSLSFLTPFVFGVSENEKLVGIISGYILSNGNWLKKQFSKRAIISGGLLLDDEISKEALMQLLDCAKKQLRRKSIYIEIRNYNDYSHYKSVFEESGFVYHPHLNFHVPTADLESSYKQLSSTKRRDIKKSLREGSEIIEIENEKNLKEFYCILSDLYKSKIKTPLFPYEFFEKLIKINEGKIWGVKYDNHIIGGSVSFCWNEKIIYELFVCGLDDEHKYLYPSTLATWAAIEYASHRDFIYFDMMGAGKPDEDYGVRQFKSKFGGQLVEHGRFLYVNHPFLYNLGKTVIKLKKRL